MDPIISNSWIYHDYNVTCCIGKCILSMATAENLPQIEITNNAADKEQAHSHVNMNYTPLIATDLRTFAHISVSLKYIIR